jgi:hypothetical protein
MNGFDNSLGKNAGFLSYGCDALGQKQILHFPIHCEFYHSLYLIEFLKAIYFLKKDQIILKSGFSLVNTFLFYFSGCPGHMHTSFIAYPYSCVYAPASWFFMVSRDSIGFNSCTFPSNLPFRSPEYPRRHGIFFQPSRFACVKAAAAFGEGVFTNHIAIYITISHTKGKPRRGFRVLGLFHFYKPNPHVLFFISPFNITARQRRYSPVCRALSDLYVSHLKLPCLAPGIREPGVSQPGYNILLPGLRNNLISLLFWLRVIRVQDDFSLGMENQPASAEIYVLLLFYKRCMPYGSPEHHWAINFILSYSDGQPSVNNEATGVHSFFPHFLGVSSKRFLNIDDRKGPGADQALSRAYAAFLLTAAVLTNRRKSQNAPG